MSGRANVGIRTTARRASVAGVTDLTAATVTAALAGLGAGRVEVVARTGSTSTDLADAVARDPAAWPHLSVLAADHQDSGRGRAGRTWTTPPGQALTFSVVLRPQVGPDRWGWVPLLTGRAVALALAPLGVTARVKWPNDVVVGGFPDQPGWGAERKVAGVLAEVVGDALVVGIGVNTLAEPVPHAVCLATLGVRPDRAGLLAAVVEHLAAGLALLAAGGAPQACAAVSATLGRRVRVERPGGEVTAGTAVTLAPDGALVVRTENGLVTVHAGDVVHLRANPPGGADDYAE